MDFWVDFHGGGSQYGVFVENWVVCVVESFGDAESLVQLVFGLELCVLVDEVVDAEFAVVLLILPPLDMLQPHMILVIHLVGPAQQIEYTRHFLTIRSVKSDHVITRTEVLVDAR